MNVLYLILGATMMFVVDLIAKFFQIGIYRRNDHERFKTLVDLIVVPAPRPSAAMDGHDRFRTLVDVMVQIFFLIGMAIYFTMIFKITLSWMTAI